MIHLNIMTFEPIVGVAHVFEMVSHAQHEKMAKYLLKEIQEVSEIPNTLPNVRIWSFLKTAILCFTSKLHVVGAEFRLSVFTTIFALVS